MPQKRRSTQRTRIKRQVKAGTATSVIGMRYGGEVVATRKDTKDRSIVTIKRTGLPAREFKGKLYLPSHTYSSRSNASPESSFLREGGMSTRIAKTGKRWTVYYRIPKHALFKALDKMD